MRAAAAQGRAMRSPACSAPMVPHQASNCDGAPDTPTPPTGAPSAVNSGTPPSMVAIIGTVGRFQSAVSSVERRNTAADRPFQRATSAAAGEAWPRAKLSSSPDWSYTATATSCPASRARARQCPVMAWAVSWSRTGAITCAGSGGAARPAAARTKAGRIAFIVSPVRTRSALRGAGCPGSRAAGWEVGGASPGRMACDAPALGTYSAATLLPRGDPQDLAGVVGHHVDGAIAPDHRLVGTALGGEHDLLVRHALAVEREQAQLARRQAGDQGLAPP